MNDNDPILPRPSAARLAESERIHRSWLNGDDPDPDAYGDSEGVRGGPEPPSEEPILPPPDPGRLAELERTHRAWLNGEDDAPAAYLDDIAPPGTIFGGAEKRDTDSATWLRRIR